MAGKSGVNTLGIRADRSTGRAARCLLALTVGASLLGAGCAHLPESLPTSGPSATLITQAGEAARDSGIQLVPITTAVAQTIRARRQQDSFASSLGTASPRDQRAGTGDGLEISVWEAPPAMLFGVTATDPRLLAGTAVVTHLPPQVIDADGTISVPFAGRIKAANATPREIERTIATRLRGKTNQIQVLARIASNSSANVTVVGEVRNSSRVGLTPAGERLLDVLASAGGVTQPVNKVTLQVTRGKELRAMPLAAVIGDPQQNIVMQPGDVLTALYQPYAFSVLGAAGRNDEIAFEANGLNLGQALARAGGVNDNRADRRGVFIFRFEEGAAIDWKGHVAMTSNGRVPVIYQLNLEDPASLLVAQQFPVEDKDVLYVSNAPAAEFQKFLNMVSSIATPFLAVRALTR